MSDWHATPEVLARFATTPEAVDDLTAASLEAHLLGCDPCRRAVATAAAGAPVATGVTWDEISDRIDRPRRTVTERLLARFVPDHVARIVAATPALRLAWLAAVSAVMAATVVVTRQAGTPAPFLALAPLVPLAGVAVSFGPAPDPAGETALATPLYGAGLLLRRAAAVFATSLLVLALGSLALPGLELRDAGWVLPALGLTFAVLALSTWVSLASAAALAAVGWLSVLETVAVSTRPPAGVPDSLVFDPAGQLAFAALAVLAAVALSTRRARLFALEVR